MKRFQHRALKGTQKGAVGPDLAALPLTPEKDREELSLDKRQPGLAFRTSQFTAALTWDAQDLGKAVVCPAQGITASASEHQWVERSPKPTGMEGSAGQDGSLGR